MSPAPITVVLKRGGRRLDALDVELLNGWARILRPVTRIEVDEDARVGRRVLEGAQWETIPQSRIARILGPEEPLP